MLHINNPEYSEERANSKPLDIEEQNYAVTLLNSIIELAQKNREEAMPTTLIQRLLHHYENLQALNDMVKGWDGAASLIEKADAYDELMKNKNIKWKS